ncbi:MAG: helix-turn-helix domain-containing protein [Acidobacteria bacterium]|nr:helix-turn-helix domain-containing protein [Acidobacteriota bacterium]
MKSVAAKAGSKVENGLGEKIKQMRLTRGLTIEALAKRAEITKGFLSKLETGKKAPTISTLGRIARALNTEASLLLESPHPKALAPDEDPGLRIGERIRQIRLARGLTLESLAQGGGITKGFLSKIERDEKAPAISTLINIANALNTEVSLLLEPGQEKERVSFVKRQDRIPTVRYKSAFGYKYTALAHHIKHKHMEPFIVLFPHHPKKQGAGLQHPGEEFVLVLKGKLLFTVGDREYVLEPGDALYFDSSLPHWGKSLSKEECEALDISFVPFA